MGEIWSAITAISTAALFVVTTIAAIAALRSVKQAREDGIQRLRPLLDVRLAKSPRGQGSLDIVISNAGQTAATDATIGIPELEDAPAEVLLTQLFLADSMTIAPGQSLRFAWTSRDGRAESMFRDAQLNLPGRGYTGQHLIELTYAGVLQPKHRHSESHVLNADIYELEDYRAMQPIEKVQA